MGIDQEERWAVMRRCDFRPKERPEHVKLSLFRDQNMVPVHVCKAFRVKARSLHAQDLAIICHTAHQQ